MLDTGRQRATTNGPPMSNADEPTNVLIVDDLPEKLLVYRTILGELNQNLVTAGSGAEALRAVLSADFAVILLDVNMPDMDGFETAALIRKRRRSAHTPIIFLTAFADEVRATEGYAQGAVDYISTPVVPAILRAKVKVFADLYRMAQQVRRQAEERVALAEERTRREAAEESNRRLAFLNHAGAVLGGSLDRDLTAREAVRLALSYLADEAALVTFGGAAGAIVGRRAADGTVAITETEWAALPPAQRAAAALVRERNATVEPGDGTLGLPLRTRDHVWAALVLSRAAGPFPEPDVAVGETFASRAAMALENARLYSEVQQADRQKNEFLSMLAHELRNPLAPIRSATEVLNQSGSAPDRLHWARGVIDRQLTHLVRLVDDLLDASRITTGKVRLTLAPISIDAVLDQAVEAARPLIERQRHRLDVIHPLTPVALQGDLTRLVQVFVNLLNNAAKYTPPGGHITLSAALREGRLEVRVRDTGVGIAPDLLPRVFDLFTQADKSLDRSQGGLGIGLTLVRGLIEMHDGTVEAHSAGAGRGSEFVVSLPATPAPAQASPPSPTTPRPGRTGPLRVVVVDDNVDGADSLVELIGLLGHQGRAAHDGPAGIDLVRAFAPDVVLLDVGLPGMDGYEVARRLRDCGAVLVTVSGYGRDEDRARSRDAGCVEHHVKPVDLGTLRRVFDTVQSA